jgi:CRP/FNR family transcriptional regulator
LRDFERWTHQNPPILQALVRLLAVRAQRFAGLLREALHVSVETRVLRRLVELGAIYDSMQAGTVVPLTQDDLASIVGTGRGTVNRVLRMVAADRILRLDRRRITILEPERLRELASVEPGMARRRRSSEAMKAEEAAIPIRLGGEGRQPRAS